MRSIKQRREANLRRVAPRILTACMLPGPSPRALRQQVLASLVASLAGRTVTNADLKSADEAISKVEDLLLDAQLVRSRGQSYAGLSRAQNRLVVRMSNKLRGSDEGRYLWSRYWNAIRTSSDYHRTTGKQPNKVIGR